MAQFNKGDTVEWNWGNGTGTGEVQAIYTEKTTVQIKGQDITRNADKDNPAYYIKQDDGDAVFKSESELKTAA